MAGDSCGAAGGGLLAKRRSNNQPSREVARRLSADRCARL